MNFLYKRKNTPSDNDDIELADFTRKKILSADASSSVEKPLKVNHHVAIVLNSDPTLQDVAKVCAVVGVPIGMNRFPGGMSNSVWKVDLCNNQSVILRIYGSDSGILVDREAEFNHFTALSELNIGPKCLATFLNGRIEEFLAASSLTCQSIQEESLAIAETMAKFHSTPCIKSDIILWNYLDKWYQAVLKILMNNSTLHNQLKTSIDIYTLGHDIKRLKSMIDFKSIVFSHNDLQYGNILKFKDSNRIIFIDFEYSGNNYLEYDIANYFCEWMADYDSVKPLFLDKSKYPSQEQQEAFIMHYLKTKYPSQEHCHLLIKAQVIMKRIPLFTSCSHLLWGFWGIINGSNGKKDGDFDYISYATSRLKMFAEIKV